MPSSILPFLPLLMLILMFLTQNHLLMSLLFLESSTLTMTLLIPLFSSPCSPFLIPIILTLSACEASVGLALLVKMVRSNGSDLIKTLIINKC